MKKMTPERHREMNTILIIIMGFAIVIAIYLTKHNMHDCEKRLFEKLTNMKAPPFEDLKKK